MRTRTAEFLVPWAEQAKETGLIVLSPIRAALAQRLGRPVAASVVRRLLARHGWRKVAREWSSQYAQGVTTAVLERL